MNIVKVVEHSEEELVERLRCVTMLQDPGAFPYKDTAIAIKSVHTDGIWPAQRYVLQSEFEKVRDLRWALLQHGYDLFELPGYVTIYLEGKDDFPIDLLPPMVEESYEGTGVSVPLLNDGMHRVFLARTCWQKIKCVLVRGVPKEYPYYAYPLVDGWNGVEIVDSIPEGYIKKFHRIPDNKKLYRNFNSAFQNVGGPRGTFGGEAYKPDKPVDFSTVAAELAAQKS